MTFNDPRDHLPSHIKLSNFQRVLIIQALRPDKLYSSIKQCVLNITGIFKNIYSNFILICTSLAGMKSLEPSILDLCLIHTESRNTEPILILTVAGADPISQVTELAKHLQVNYLEVTYFLVMCR